MVTDGEGTIWVRKGTEPAGVMRCGRRFEEREGGFQRGTESGMYVRRREKNCPPDDLRTALRTPSLARVVCSYGGAAYPIEEAIATDDCAHSRLVAAGSVD